MIMLKTAALFRVTFELSGLIAEATPETVKRLASFGEEVGMAHQVRTDILGVWGVEDTFRDPNHVTPRFRRTMYPLIAAHEDGTDKDRQFLEGTFQGMPPMDGNIEKILALLDRLAIRAASEDQMKAHLQEAAKHVPYIPFSESALQALTDWFDDLTAFTRPLSS
jgi:geranylgeranyl diphosphate synthase type I